MIVLQSVLILHNSAECTTRNIVYIRWLRPLSFCQVADLQRVQRFHTFSLEIKIGSYSFSLIFLEITDIAHSKFYIADIRIILIKRNFERTGYELCGLTLYMAYFEIFDNNCFSRYGEAHYLIVIYVQCSNKSLFYHIYIWYNVTKS